MPAGVAVGLFGLVPFVAPPVAPVEPDDPFIAPDVSPEVLPDVPDAAPCVVLLGPLIAPDVDPPVVPVVPVTVPPLLSEAPALPVLLVPGLLSTAPDVDDVDEGVDEGVDDGVDDESLPPDDVEGVAVELPVALVVEGFDIELSVFGVSVLLQAERAARVAAMATHWMERAMVGSW